jgi:RNA polymerase primary sigma factor
MTNKKTNRQSTQKTVKKVKTHNQKTVNDLDKGLWKSSRHDPGLGKYFSDLANHKVLTSEQEIEIAKKLASLEIERWTVALREVSIVPQMIQAIETQMTPDHQIENFSEFREYINSILNEDSAKEHNPAVIKQNKQRYTETIAAIAAKIHEQDINRDFISSVHRIVLALTKDERTNKEPKWINLVKDCEILAARVRAVKHSFIRANLRLVVSIARRYDRGQMPFIDIIQEGNLGLIKAVERFDYRKGFRFNTYASWWIRHAIGRALADKGHAVRVPVHALDAQQRLGKAVEAITSRLGRAPTEEELVKETGINSRKLAKVQKHKMTSMTSLDKEVSGTDDRKYIDMLMDDRIKTPFENTMLSAWNKNMESALSILTPMEQSIIRWRYGLDTQGEEMTLKEIGDFYSLSRERIRQLQEQALLKLRRKLDVDAA